MHNQFTRRGAGSPSASRISSTIQGRGGAPNVGGSLFTSTRLNRATKSRAGDREAAIGDGNGIHRGVGGDPAVGSGGRATQVQEMRSTFSDVLDSTSYLDTLEVNSLPREMDVEVAVSTLESSDNLDEFITEPEESSRGAPSSGDDVREEEGEEKQRPNKHECKYNKEDKDKEADGELFNVTKQVERSEYRKRLKDKVGDVLSLIETTLASPEEQHQGHQPRFSERRCSIFRSGTEVMDQDEYNEYMYPSEIMLEAVEDGNKEDEEQKLIEARQNFFLKLEEATHMAEETLKYINHNTEEVSRMRRFSSFLSSPDSAANLLIEKSGEGEGEGHHDDDHEHADNEDDAASDSPARTKDGPIEFGNQRDRDAFARMGRTVQALTKKLRVNERTKGIEQVSRWLTNKKMRLINDTKLLGDLEKEAQLVNIEFGSGSRALNNDINNLEETQEKMLIKFRDHMKKVNEQSRLVAVKHEEEQKSKGEVQAQRKQARKEALETELKRVRSELKLVESSIEDVGSSRKLDEVRQLNDKYEARTKHLLDIIEQQQTKISKLTSELSMSDTQVMQMELNHREMLMQQQMDSRDVLLRKKIVEAEQKKKKIIHRKMLRQQMEKRILEEAEDEDEDEDEDNETHNEEKKDSGGSELKKAHDLNKKLHGDLQTMLDKIDETEAAIADAIPAEVRVKKLQAELKAVEKENDKMEYRLRTAEQKIRRINAPQEGDKLYK